MIEVADAREWLRDHWGELLLTDPPHMDRFAGWQEHADFVADWLPLALVAADVVVHSCGTNDPYELLNYLTIATPQQVVIWTHESGYHLFLVYHAARSGIQAKVLRAEKPDPLWKIWIWDTSVGSVIDPFCGRGEIPMAAASLGVAYSGCDIDPHAVEACRANGLAIR